MDSRRKDTFPPLYESGFKQFDADKIEECFLGPTSRSPRRTFLTSQLRLFINKLQSLGVKGELWVNGSFSTRNLNPMDLDLLLVIPRIILSTMEESAKKELRELIDKKNRGYIRSKWSVDFYVAEQSDLSSLRYFEELFSRNPDSENPKGIPVIKI